MLKSGTPTPHGALLTMESVFHAVLRNAEFWELDSLTGLRIVLFV